MYVFTAFSFFFFSSSRTEIANDGKVFMREKSSQELSENQDTYIIHDHDS